MARLEDAFVFSSLCLAFLAGLATLVASGLVLLVGAVPLVVALFSIGFYGMGAAVVVLFSSVSFHRSR